MFNLRVIFANIIRNLISGRTYLVMIKISRAVLCAIVLAALSGSSGAVPDSGGNEESQALKTFLKCSNNVMVASLGLEIHYKQIPATQIQISSLRTGTPSTNIRNYLSSFARITLSNKLKSGSTVLQPGNYMLGLQEEKPGNGRWFFAILEPGSGRQLVKLDPVFDTLAPNLCARVMTMEIDRRPGSNRFKIKMKWGDLSITTKEMLEI
jgi:hypothetical protein